MTTTPLRPGDLVCVTLDDGTWTLGDVIAVSPDGRVSVAYEDPTAPGNELAEFDRSEVQLFEFAELKPGQTSRLWERFMKPRGITKDADTH